ncbi:hypothetical protein P3T35_007963 [Kitasatospora sp. GP30]|uniref:hypothetical protein n=1 Tax=Kitasatospora sp. GP30 TaxID=3035084 RepID=UPI000C707365|nr:hypothetical protein [Kitasatospora sp. GP30]MDH6145902.1 hypothetical protein [Kitasatospora sp. GP30]
MVLHASRVWRPREELSRLCAVGFSARLGALLALPVLLWAATTDAPIGWERAALVLALLRMAQDVQVSGVVTGRR